MTALPEGFQVKARDHDGNVHDERWSTSSATAVAVVADLGSDSLVAEAWIEPAPHFHDATGTENTPCWCPWPGTYAPQGDGTYGSEEAGQ